MTSSFEAEITISAKANTKAIYDSVKTDNKFYPENPTKTKISMKKFITISIESDHLPHMRANINSTLRLVQASHDSIESVKI